MDVTPATKLEVKSTEKPEVKPGVEPEVKPNVHPEAKPGVEPIIKPNVHPEAKPGVEPTVKPNVHPEAKPDVTPTPLTIPASNKASGDTVEKSNGEGWFEFPIPKCPTEITSSTPGAIVVVDGSTYDETTPYLCVTLGNHTVEPVKRVI